MKRLGLYIHWPFCRSKCPYCDFFSHVKANIPQSTIIKEYLEDLEFYRNLNNNYKVDTIFFGGGTPSLIEPRYIENIIDKITSLWPHSSDIEISLEANPNTNTPTLFEDLKLAGINRLSLGVQALNDKDLRFLGRTHSLKEAHKAIDSVLQNFNNHSIDLIYARPEQTQNSWENELREATKFGFKHLSLYQLTIEPDTTFAKLGIQQMEEQLATKLYELSEKVIVENGYKQYEISNYAIDGYECKHNLGYWHGDDYIGVGKGAVGYIHHNNKIYTTTHRRKMEEVAQQERAEELIIMGLRLNEGINKKRFQDVCGIDISSFIRKNLIDNELLIDNNEYLKVTDKGRLLLNYVIERLCL